ncbi:hypothetical protein J4479_01720 [Candidatus Woesearchaeota archaeon]|nr:hypothetical protein [Candidatus Woesearchaeota archaeon]
MNRRCPKCGSDNTELYEDLAFIKCRNCGYDELTTEPFPYDVRKSQREKGRFTPYKQGGSRRIVKK